MPFLPLLVFSLAAAAAPGLRLDPLDPPRAVPGTERLWLFPAPDRQEATPFEVLDGVVVRLAGGQDAGALLPADAWSLGGRSWLVPTASPAAAVALAQRLQSTPGVAAAFPDVTLEIVRHASLDFDDPEYGGQWYLQDLGMASLYAVSMGDPAVRAAVMDSGIDIGHSDLSPAVINPYDAYSDDDDPSPDDGEYCGTGQTGICDEHGTAVSGIVAARANNGAGIVGLCPECSLIPVKILGEGNGSTNSTVVAAYEHAISSDAAVINNSWGFTESIPVPSTIAAAIEAAATETRGGLGAVVVFAAGNDGHEVQDDEMQALPYVLCVGATDSYGQPTAYTNYGDPLDLAAPSATVSIAPDESFTETFGGTSAASPVVAGIAAWVLSVDPTLSATQVRDLLVDTAVPSPLVSVDDNGHSAYFGYGELDAQAVLEALVGAADSGDTGADDGRAGCACSSSPQRGLAWWLLPLLGVGLVRRRR